MQKGLVVICLLASLSPLFGEDKYPSGIRGTNYQPARSKGIGDFLANYVPAETEIDISMISENRVSMG